MSYLVARMEKMKKQNLGGIQRHNQREFKNHSNKEIDVERSHLNYDLVNPEKIKYQEKIMSTIEAQRESKRAVRKDAVLVNEWIITSDQEFFKEMDEDETRSFFETATEFFQKRYSEQNIVFAHVHLDETTPHMHLGVVPMKDGKLSSKDVFTRKELLAIQEEMPRFMNERGFNVNRGEEKSDRKHLTIPQYKDMQRRIAEMASEEGTKAQEVKALSEEKERLEAHLSEYKEYVEEKQGKQPVVIGKKKEVTLSNGQKVNAYTVSEEELLRLDAIRKGASAVMAENKLLEKENKQLKARVKVLERAQQKMAALLKTAQKHASRFAEGVFERAMTYAKQFSKNEPDVQKVQDQMLEDVKESPAGKEDYNKWEAQRRKREMSRNGMEL